MATIVQDYGFSLERTEFSGSTEEDKAHAKSFWQSVQLNPPMESRLVSSDVRQRLKVAPTGYQKKNIAHGIPEEPPQLTKFLEEAKAMEKIEEMQKMAKLTSKKEQTQTLLYMQREERKQKEQISQSVRTRTDGFEAAKDSDDDEEDAIAVVRDLDKVGQIMDSDSD